MRRGIGIGGFGHRPSIPSDTSSFASTATDTSSWPTNGGSLGVDMGQKPTLSGAGVKATIRLAEPMLFLQGDGPNNDTSSPPNTAMLRGSLHLQVTKSAKIKAVTLKFRGRAVTRWPEGIPPQKTEFEEVANIMNHTWPFFNAAFPDAEQGTGAHHFAPLKTSASFKTTDSPNTSSTNLSAKDVRRLSLQANHSPSSSKVDATSYGPTVSSKGYRTFHPGDYYYHFELPIDSRLPETIDVDLGNVKYELEATIERAGAFKTNLIGQQEVLCIRVPPENSLEQVEPIAISRTWEDQLHYEIVISGKSFPMGGQVPIAFKLTPLAKVQCHRIKIFITQNVEYFCNRKKIHRVEPVSKLQLVDKRADSSLDTTYPGSRMRITAGGGVPYDARASAAAGIEVATEDSCNLLGNLNGETNIGPTEMEFCVQLPSCNSDYRGGGPRLHFDTTYQNIQVHHWIKVSSA